MPMSEQMLRGEVQRPRSLASRAELIGRVNAGNASDEQRGHYDIVVALFDFCEVRVRLSSRR